MMEKSAMTVSGLRDNSAIIIQAFWRGTMFRLGFQQQKELLMRHEKLRKVHSDINMGSKFSQSVFASEAEMGEIHSEVDSRSYLAEGNYFVENFESTYKKLSQHNLSSLQNLLIQTNGSSGRKKSVSSHENLSVMSRGSLLSATASADNSKTLPDIFGESMNISSGTHQSLESLTASKFCQQPGSHYGISSFDADEHLFTEKSIQSKMSSQSYPSLTYKPCQVTLGNDFYDDDLDNSLKVAASLAPKMNNFDSQHAKCIAMSQANILHLDETLMAASNVSQTSLCDLLLSDKNQGLPVTSKKVKDSSINDISSSKSSVTEKVRDIIKPANVHNLNNSLDSNSSNRSVGATSVSNSYLAAPRTLSYRESYDKLETVRQSATYASIPSLPNSTLLPQPELKGSSNENESRVKVSDPAVVTNTSSKSSLTSDFSLRGRASSPSAIGSNMMSSHSQNVNRRKKVYTKKHCQNFRDRISSGSSYPSVIPTPYQHFSILSREHYTTSGENVEKKMTRSDSSQCLSDNPDLGQNQLSNKIVNSGSESLSCECKLLQATFKVRGSNIINNPRLPLKPWELYRSDKKRIAIIRKKTDAATLIQRKYRQYLTETGRHLISASKQNPVLKNPKACKSMDDLNSSALFPQKMISIISSQDESSSVISHFPGECNDFMHNSKIRNYGSWLDMRRQHLKKIAACIDQAPCTKNDHNQYKKLDHYKGEEIHHDIDSISSLEIKDISKKGESIKKDASTEYHPQDIIRLEHSSANVTDIESIVSKHVSNLPELNDSKCDYSDSDSAIDEISEQEYAALVIQLAWRSYYHKKLIQEKLKSDENAESLSQFE